MLASTRLWRFDYESAVMIFDNAEALAGITEHPAHQQDGERSDIRWSILQGLRFCGRENAQGRQWIVRPFSLTEMVFTTGHGGTEKTRATNEQRFDE